jgi:hypothetical protein
MLKRNSSQRSSRKNLMLGQRLMIWVMKFHFDCLNWRHPDYYRDFRFSGYLTIK